MIAEPVWPDPMTVDGTNGTSRARLAMSVDWGGPEVAG
jgi:hypothetical protein